MSFIKIKFNEEKLNICQVSLAGNISTINKNLNNFEKYYKKIRFFIICPKKEIIIFKKKIKNKNCQIIDENKIINFILFKKNAEKYLKKTNYFKQIKPRLKWYYQQILKMAFLLDFIEKTKQPMVIWDADTIILDKIDFFENKTSINYGTTSEFYKAYYLTNTLILKKLPKYFISSLTQFTSLTPKETKFFIKKLKRFKFKKKSNAQWITEIVFDSLTKAHEKYNGSMFSEYELIGQSKLILNSTKQKLISGIRENLNGKLTDFQIFIVKILGYKYVAYEYTHNNDNSINMLKRYQTWFQFLKLITKKTSNKFFRGIKHQFKSYIL